MTHRALLIEALLFGPILLPSSLWGEDTYRIGYSKYRDISSMEQKLNMTRAWGERLRVFASGANAGDMNETLKRFRDSRGGDFGVNLLLARELELALSGEGRRTRDEGSDYENQTTENELSIGLSYSPFEYVSLFTSIGQLTDQYQRRSLGADTSTTITNRGMRDSLLVTIEREENHAHYLQIGESRDITDKRVRELGCGIKRRIFDWVESEFEVEGEVWAENYPTLEGRERKDSKSGSGQLSLTAQPTSSLRLQLTAAMQGEDHTYASPENPEAREKGRKIRRRGIDGHVAYSLIEPLELNLNLGRTFRERDYRKDRSDEYLDEKSFNGSVKYQLRGGSSVRFERTIDLSSYEFPHRYNFDDRDLLNQSLGLVTHFLLPRATSLLTKISTQDNRIVYMKGEASANNRRLTVYEFSNLVGFSPLRNLEAENTLGIRANYTTYQFNPERNTLVRSVRLGSKLSYGAKEVHPYQGDYLLTIEDRGAYLFSAKAERWGYRKDTQIFKHELSLSVPLLARETYSLVPSYRLKSIETFGYTPEGEKTGKGRDDEHYLGGRGDLVLSKASTFAFSVERVLREGNPFWDLSLSLSYNL